MPSSVTGPGDPASVSGLGDPSVCFIRLVVCSKGSNFEGWRQFVYPDGWKGFWVVVSEGSLDDVAEDVLKYVGEDLPDGCRAEFTP